MFLITKQLLSNIMHLQVSEDEKFRPTVVIRLKLWCCVTACSVCSHVPGTLLLVVALFVPSVSQNLASLATLAAR